MIFLAGVISTQPGRKETNLLPMEVRPWTKTASSPESCRLPEAEQASEFRVFGIAVNSYATSRIGRLSNHNIEKLKTCILYIICID